MNKQALRGDGRRSGISIVVAALAGLLVYSTVVAQGPNHRMQAAGELAARPARPSGEILRGLERLKWFAKQHAWDDFADLATQLSADEAQGWMLLRDGYYIGVRDAVNRQIAALPREGLAAYRQRVDGLAASWLKQGVAERDDALLRKVIREAFCSTSADDALWSLGEIALERGDYTAARLAWRRVHKETAGDELLAYPNSRIDLDAVRARLALVSIRERSFAQAEQEIAELAEQHPTASGHLAGVEGAFVATLRQVLDEAKKERPRQPSTGNWPTLGGSYRRSNVNVNELRFNEQDKWQQAASLPITERPDGPEQVVLPPPGFPIVVNGRIIFQDAAGIHGCSIEAEKPTAVKTRDLWKAPPGAPAINVPTPSVNYDRLVAIVPYRAPEKSEWSTQLIGLDLSRDGALFFQRSPETAGAVFFGSPLVYRSRVIIAECAIAQGVRMAVSCYDVWTGALRWRRELGSAYMPLAPNGAPLVNFVLSEDSGIVYANTNAGMIAAIHADDGAPLWLRTYDRTFAAGSDAVLEPPTPNPGILHRGNLLVAADDSQDTHCLDAADGHSFWRTTRPDGSRLLAVDDRGVLLAGHRLWRVPLNNGQLDSKYGEELAAGVGQATVAGDLVFWPTPGEILLVDRATGKPTSRALALPAIGGTNVVVAKVRAGEASEAKADYYVVAQGSAHLTAWSRTTAGAEESNQTSQRGAPDAR